MATIPAYRGEFGLMVRFHVPKVYAMGPGHVIEIEEGSEALYPLAAEHRIVPRVPEDAFDGASQARGRIGRPKLKGPEKRFRPEPHVRQGVRADVVITPRKRDYGASKNWGHWPAVADALTERGLRVFAGGVRDASDTTVHCDAAWNYARPLDATIEAMRGARLVIAACSGLAHLAVLCGNPLLLFTYRGMVAPGPVITSNGDWVQDDYWPVRMQEYYHAANHTGAPIVDMDGWEYPERIIGRAVEMLP